MHKAQQLTKERLEEVEKHLTGDSEPSELIYFKVYRTQLPVIEQALEIAARMLGSDRSRGYLLEMIYADFLAGACSEEHPTAVLDGIRRLCPFLSEHQRHMLAQELVAHENHHLRLLANG